MDQLFPDKQLGTGLELRDRGRSLWIELPVGIGDSLVNNQQLNNGDALDTLG
jgi:hypothetical protein